MQNNILCNIARPNSLKVMAFCHVFKYLQSFYARSINIFRNSRTNWGDNITFSPCICIMHCVLTKRHVARTSILYQNIFERTWTHLYDKISSVCKYIEFQCCSISIFWECLSALLFVWQTGRWYVCCCWQKIDSITKPAAWLRLLSHMWRRSCQVENLIFTMLES